MAADRPSCLSLVPPSMVSGAARSVLDTAGRLTVWDGAIPIPRENLLDLLPGIEGLLVVPLLRLDREALDAAPRLRVVATMSAGYDHIDVGHASARGILVCNAPGFNAESVADHAFALMLAVARRVEEQGRFLRQGRYVEVHTGAVFGQPVHGATLGLVGLGTIGAAVARRAGGFGMRLLYTGRTRKPDLEAALGLAWTTLDDLLRRSDIVSLHAALTAETGGLIGAQQLRRMKPTAILVNTARGALVDTDALCQALRERWIFGAGLDVTDPEPLPVDHPLLTLANAVVTPHTGYASAPILAQMVEAAASGLADALAGRRPRFLVNHGVWNEAIHGRPS